MGKREKGKASWFRRATLLVLFAFTASIVALFLADVAYVDLKSMKSVFLASRVGEAFLLSLVTSIVAMVLSVLVAVPSGYALSRYPFRGMIILDVIIDALIVLPVLVIGISLLVFFREGADLVLPGRALVAKAWELSLGGSVLERLWASCLDFTGQALILAGLRLADLGGVFIYQRAGIVLAQFFCSASYAVRVMKATFDELDPRTEQVAMTLGCSRASAFWRVTLPLARHGIIAAAVLSWARSVGVFGPVQIVAGAVRGRTEVLPTAIYLEISVGQLEAALAMSLIMIMMALAVLLALKTFSKSTLFGAGGAR